MTASPSQPEILETPDGPYPLHVYQLNLAGREWSILHTGLVLTHAEEAQFIEERFPRLPYGVALWSSSIVLAYELAHRGEAAFRGKSLLELGAGTGLPGIVAASLGAQTVQTDRQELSMSVCRRNAERNRVPNLEHRMVDWTEWNDPTRYDWIIGSDILYGQKMHPHLERIFRDNLAPGGRILLSDPLRSLSVRLLEKLEQEGWQITATRWKLGEEKPRTSMVWELQRNAPASRAEHSPAPG